MPLPLLLPTPTSPEARWLPPWFPLAAKAPGGQRGPHHISSCNMEPEAGGWRHRRSLLGGGTPDGEQRGRGRRVSSENFRPRRLGEWLRVVEGEGRGDPCYFLVFIGCRGD